MVFGLRLPLAQGPRPLVVAWHGLVAQALLLPRQPLLRRGLVLKEVLVDLCADQGSVGSVQRLRTRCMLLPAELHPLAAQRVSYPALRVRDPRLVQPSLGLGGVVVGAETGRREDSAFLYVRSREGLVGTVCSLLALVAEARAAAPLLQILLHLLPLPRLGAPEGLRPLFQIFKLSLLELCGGVHRVDYVVVAVAEGVANDSHF